ncbi:AraC family transcriptional regulator [Paenibacillus antri]|uniref:AraC family transcriptional regulator n=1 Tax=Paenibacillus antri TaxID=2582848 RepID=A0A5R9GIF8_9BACL|nr:helix-turn-helix domain-containing protein [Paenibacillus antri]TLS54296.1 AraC family transcriptional regulator [Paenibacillus antri]
MKRWVDVFRVNKMFLNILLSFLSLIIPVVLLGWISYVNFVNELKREYTEKIELHLTSSSHTVENYWKTIYEAGVNFYGDPAVRRLLRTSTWASEEDRSDLHELFESIDRTRFHVNQFAEELFVYADGTYVMTSDGANDFRAFFEKFRRYDGMDAEDWLATLDSDRSLEIVEPSRVTTSFQATEAFSLLVRNRSGKNRAVLVADVPVANVVRALQPVLDQGATEVVVTDGDGNVVLSTDERFANARDWGGDAGSASARSVENAEVRIDGERYIVSAVSTSTFGWTYRAITPLQAFRSQAQGILRLITVISIALCVIGTAFALLFSLKIYKPIRRIVEVYLEEDNRQQRDDAEPKRPNDLYAVGDGIRQWMSYRGRYLDEWQSMAREYADHALLQIVRGSDRNRKRDEELVRILQTQLNFKKDGYLCCAITFEFKDTFFRDVQDVERIVIENKMKNLIQGYLSEYAPLHVLESNDHLYVAIANVRTDEETERFKAGVAEFIRTFEYDRQYYHIRIGIGQPFAGLDGIAKSYRGAMAALRTLPPEDPSRVACAASPNDAQDVPYSYADENKLLKALRFGSKEEVEHAVDELLRKSGHALFARSGLIGEMYHTATRFAMERGIDADRLASESERTALTNSGPFANEQELEERQRLLVSYMHRMIETHLGPKQTQKSSQLAQTIKAYIEENYTNDLHLEHIADKMEVSVKYVSRVFKEHYNMNLTDYISELRIQLAKELLKSSGMAIQDISERVGFYNRTTFLRTFKKLEGTSPNEYRQRLRA